MSGAQPKRRVRRRPLKTKPAVVPKRKKLKTARGPKIDFSVVIPKGITKWNIIFTIIFTSLLIITIINAYFKTIIVIPLSDLILNILYPVLLFIEIILVLLAFETYKISAIKTPIRLILSVLTLFVLFPITLLKYYTRHNIWRIFFTGFTIWTLLFSFFSPYVNLIGKYRDLPEGQLEEQNVNADWFSSLYHGSAPFYIDGLLDLLDALDLNETLQQQDMAEVVALDGTLGNFLYRWEVYDYYNPTTWEFEGSNDAILYNLEDSDYGRPGATNTVRMQISETVYSATTSLQNSLLTTWSTYYRPHIDKDDDWDDNFLDENDTTINAKDGTAKVRFNDRDQLSLTATMGQIGFVGKFQYITYFASDGDIQQITQNVVTRDQANMGTEEFNNTYAKFLQIPNNYETTSPKVVAYARQKLDTSLTIYQQIVKDLDSILLEFGLPESAKSDNQGQDRAERLLNGEDKSASAYLALAVMMLRLQGIPARPVFGFAIGEGTSTARTLKLQHLYGWVEALLPINEGGEIHYRWGQFQIGPYVTSDFNYVYCENTLYSSYNVTVQMFQGSEANEVQKYDVGGGEEVYLLDNDYEYIIRAYVTSSNGNPATGVPLAFTAYTSAELQLIQSGQGSFDQYGRNVGTAVTNTSGYAVLRASFNASTYPLFDSKNPDATSFVLIGFVTLTSIGYAPFVIFPMGYLTPLQLNATKLTLPNPQNPLETFDYYILQKGWRYNVSTYLYQDEGHTTPLGGRNVTFYLLTQQELQQLQQTGEIDYNSLTKIGIGKTDSNGFVAISTYSNGQDKLANLALNTTYVIAAQYGLGYNYTVILIIDGLRSTVSVNDTVLDVSTDGLTTGIRVTGNIYFENPIGGTEPVDTQVEFWIVPADPAVYKDYDGTMNASVYKEQLISLNSTYGNPPPYKIHILGQTTTNSTGDYSFDFVLDASQLGVGSYRVIVFFEDRWNASTTIYIQSPPSLVLTSQSNNNEIILYRPFYNHNLLGVALNNFGDMITFCISNNKEMPYNVVLCTTAFESVSVIGVIEVVSDKTVKSLFSKKKGF